MAVISLLKVICRKDSPTRAHLLDEMVSAFKPLLLVCVLTLVHGAPSPRKKGYGPGDQDWGFIKVRDKAHMFYWLYATTAKTNAATRPLVIWLQGGPGVSSTGFGNFMEVGPIFPNGTARPHAWTKHVNLMFIDNPVGTGFSYVESDNCYVKNNEQIGKDMIAFLSEFYKTHPQFAKVPTYIFAESYGGKMAVEIGKQLDESVKSGKIKANFKGLALIDSWISPGETANSWPSYLLATGLINIREFKHLRSWAAAVKEEVDGAKYSQAFADVTWLLHSISTATKGVDFYNILNRVPHVLSEDRSNKTYFLMQPANVPDIENLMNGPVRKALQIPKNIKFQLMSQTVYNELEGDMMRPVVKVVEHLLNETRIQVNVLNGQLDLIVDNLGTISWVESLKWGGKKGWEKSIREALLVDGYVEGYFTQFKNLAFYWVDRSGHMIPKDNPVAAEEILRRIVGV